MKIAAIARSTEHSPNMTEKDFAILNAVAMLLRNKGFDVDILEENEYSGQKCYNAIYHMSRNGNTLEMLEKAESQGTTVINRASAVRRCERENFTEILRKENIPQPLYTKTEYKKQFPDNGYPLWLKKGKGWSCHRDDVCMVSNREEATKAIESFHKRNVDCFLYCPHIVGDIVKFYGVNNKFFRWHYPAPESSKFGLEKFNGTISHHPFNCDKLRETAFKAARAIGIEIFGGDCIITPHGEIFIIDINDFPSFSMYREEAANAIAEIIITKSKKDERE